jgi:hypothetical protein
VSAAALTRVLADPHRPGSVSARARERRWAELTRRFGDLGALRVLDLGGTAAFWRGAPVRPAELVLLNLSEQEPPWAEGCRVVRGDACAPPADLAREPFDLVVANSVIGHVGGHERRRRLADAVHALGTHHWVQTPYRYFPVDSIFLFPAFPLLPVPARVAVSLHWPLGHRRARTRAEALDLVLGLEALTRTELAHLFPDSELWSERVAGVTKSLVAVR